MKLRFENNDNSLNNYKGLFCKTRIMRTVRLKFYQARMFFSNYVKSQIQNTAENYLV